MAFWDTVLTCADDVPCGKQVMPVIIDEKARTHPEHACFSIQRPDDPKGGFRNVNWRTVRPTFQEDNLGYSRCLSDQYANAINKTAHFIQREIGRGAAFDCVMYLGYPDLRAFIVLVAPVKTGHKALFSSYHNSMAAHIELIRQTDCSLILYTAGFPVTGILEKSRAESVCLPELATLLEESQCDPYPYNKTFEEAKQHPCFVIQDSGSGDKRPIIWTHQAVNAAIMHQSVRPLEGRPTVSTDVDFMERTFCGSPTLSASWLVAILRETCFSNRTVVFGPS